jgi:tripartite-type tricarboxylate transporter receptor subunit TctC
MRQGQLRGLAVASAKRLSVAPYLPTMAEHGVAGVEISSWSELFVPAKTSREIIRTIHVDTISEQAVGERLEQGGVVVIGSTPASFLSYKIAKWDSHQRG